MGGSRKGVPNKTTRYDTDILPRLEDIKKWLNKGIPSGRFVRNLPFLLILGIVNAS